MRIAYVTAEAHPFIKTGGLADVAHSLPSALSAIGVEPTVFLPCYRQVRAWLDANASPVEPIALRRALPIGGTEHALTYETLAWHGHRVVFVVNDHFYDRPHPYLDEQGADYADSVARWSFFCGAVLEYYHDVEPRPDVVHVNDWQTALIPVYLRATGGQLALADTASLLTIHNIAYQGLSPTEQLADTGLGPDILRPDALEFFGRLNLLKGGIVFADALNTVSPTYAEEIQTEEYGKGLHGVLQAERHKLSGILNGIDTDEWNPATDPHLSARYDVNDLAGKAVCKAALQRRMNLPERKDAFVLGVISRFDVQKGIHLIAAAFPELDELVAQIVVLGAGDPKIQRAVEDLVRTQPGRVAAFVGFDEPLAHQIEAGADAFLMPSAYEPCGLNQMYSQRYGTVPIVRETGGLKDTVVDASPARLADGTASGFSFSEFQAGELAAAIRRAAHLFFSDRVVWRALVRAIMQLDHSWSRSARAYIDLYDRLAARAPRT